MIRGYQRHFGVDWLCAIKELQMLGVRLNSNYVEQLKRTVKGCQKANRDRRLKKKENENQIFDPDCDERFAFITGYTSNGFAYGITWEEIEGTPRDYGLS